MAVVAEIANNRPGVKHIRLTETIAVVPVANLLVFFCRVIVLRHFLHFTGSKPKIFAVAFIQDGVDLQIVQSAENAFSGNTKDTGQKAETQVGIILQCAGEQVAHKADYGIIKTVQMSLLNRGIVFVDNDNRCNSIVLVQVKRKKVQ